MWTVSDLAPLKKVFVTKNNKSLVNILRSEGVDVEEVPPLQHNYEREPSREDDWYDAPYATRDCGFFHGNRFYGGGHHPFIKGVGCEIIDGFGGGGVISDGKVALISAWHMGSGPTYRTGNELIGYLEKELKVECRRVPIGRHIDFFINFLNSNWIVYNKRLADELRKENRFGDEEIDSLEKAINFLSGRGYSVLEIDRNAEAYFKRGHRYHDGGVLMEGLFLCIGNMLPIRDGVVVMIQDLNSEFCENIGWYHLPSELRKKGFKVYEVEHDDRNPWGYDTGPRCRTLPMREAVH